MMLNAIPEDEEIGNEQSALNGLLWLRLKEAVQTEKASIVLGHILKLPKQTIFFLSLRVLGVVLEVFGSDLYYYALALEDVHVSKSPIPLSPQWLLSKSGEMKSGLTGENHFSSYIDYSSHPDIMKSPGIGDETRENNKKKDVLGHRCWIWTLAGAIAG